jgi:hypothetical protein
VSYFNNRNVGIHKIAVTWIEKKKNIEKLIGISSDNPSSIAPVD